jgi:chromosome segregation ATPase
VEARAQQLRAALAPLQQRRKQLEAERDRLGRDVKARDGELRQLQERTARGQQELTQLEGKVLALRSGDVVLLKASRGVALERLLPLLPLLPPLP